MPTGIILARQEFINFWALENRSLPSNSNFATASMAAIASPLFCSQSKNLVGLASQTYEVQPAGQLDRFPGKY